MGGTRVICTASLVDSVPALARGVGRRLADGGVRRCCPRRPGSRKPRDVSRGRPDGRTVEIQRLIGRSLRAVVDLDALGPAHACTSTATCCRPTAARAARRSPAASSRCELALERLVEQGDARAAAADGFGRGRVVRHRRRRAAARPRLPRGLRGRGRHERGDDRRRRAGRGAGHRRRGCRSRAPRSTSCWASRRRASRSCARAQRGGGRRRPVGAPRGCVRCGAPCAS